MKFLIRYKVSNVVYHFFVEEPYFVRDAMKKSAWKLAMEEEMLAIEKNGTQVLVPPPKNIKKNCLKFVFN